MSPSCSDENLGIAQLACYEHTDTAVSLPHIVMNWLLLGLYVSDIALRLYAMGMTFFESVVNCAEFFLTLCDVLLECWTNIPRILTVCKVVRFFRLGRIIRSSDKLRELYLMCLGILTSIRAMLFGTALVGCALVLFSILAVYFVRPVAHAIDDRGGFPEGCIDCRSAFDTVHNACLTFMTTIIAGDSWGRVSLPLVQERADAALIIYLAFFSIELGLLNTIAAVIVDKQVQARAEDEEYMLMLESEEVLNSFDKMSALFEALDADGSGAITLEELSEYYDDHADFRTLLNRMDIHRDQIPIVFEIIDRDSSGTIDFAEFVAGLHNLKNEDTHTLAVLSRHFGEMCYEVCTEMKSTLAIQTEMLVDVPEKVTHPCREFFDKLRNDIDQRLADFKRELLSPGFYTDDLSKTLRPRSLNEIHGARQASCADVPEEHLHILFHQDSPCTGFMPSLAHEGLERVGLPPGLDLRSVATQTCAEVGCVAGGKDIPSSPALRTLAHGGRCKVTGQDLPIETPELCRTVRRFGRSFVLAKPGLGVEKNLCSSEGHKTSAHAMRKP
eukprot:TRINITY_DN34832_c0_g1_i1.p1 TRINITY_DN34832_c0_g1~~TRINITY_DN34832_c0_g1_i1.p1  ORF type:complete len:557 (+),score=66.03 TRINITY_DN34832_c0_g1_i1:27-1697(+)